MIAEFQTSGHHGDTAADPARAAQLQVKHLFGAPPLTAAQSERQGMVARKLQTSTAALNTRGAAESKTTTLIQAEAVGEVSMQLMAPVLADGVQGSVSSDVYRTYLRACGPSFALLVGLSYMFTNVAASLPPPRPAPSNAAQSGRMSGSPSGATAT